MMDKKRQTNLREAKVIQVIETKTVVGSGTENDLIRIVAAYWSFEGKLLAFRDPDINGEL